LLSWVVAETLEVLEDRLWVPRLGVFGELAEVQDRSLLGLL
jgi:hypothetical protein